MRNQYIIKPEDHCNGRTIAQGAVSSTVCVGGRQSFGLGMAAFACCSRSSGARKVLKAAVAVAIVVQLARQLIDTEQVSGVFIGRSAVISQPPPPFVSRRSGAHTPYNHSIPARGLLKLSSDAHVVTAAPADVSPNFSAAATGLPDLSPDTASGHAVGVSSSSSQPARRRLVLLWTTFFRSSFLEAMKGSFPPNVRCDQLCELTNDRKRVSEADALLFHASDISRQLPNERRADQLWVLFTIEPPTNGYVLPQYDGLFNLTMTYRSDSDIEVGYGHTETLELAVNGSSPDAQPTRKPLLAAVNFSKRKPYAYWMVSNCKDARMAYVRELAKHIRVDVYGQCAPPGSRKCTRNPDATNETDCEAELSATYAFYLAFESSLCPDYVTEKMWRTLSSPGGAIPVVIGAAPSRYAQIAPPASYVHAQRFATPRDLAAHMKRVASSHGLFMSYHQWRERHVVHDGWYYELANGLCRLCELMKSDKGRSRPAKANLYGWFRSGCVTRWPMGS